MSLPVFNARAVPADIREWMRELSPLNTWVRRGRDRVHARDQKFLHPVNSANRNSVQNSDTILTASSDATSSTIQIASHSVRFDFQDDPDVAYNSGTITGLTPETVYYVYTSDPDYDGGAVVYLATTNPDNLIVQGQYYVGFVATPITGDTEAVTAATSANPIAITTATAHGWSSGQSVSFAAMPGDFGTNLNGNTYVITVTGASTFTIPVDGSLYVAYTNGGTATRVTTANQSGGGAGAGVGGGRFDYLGGG